MRKIVILMGLLAGAALLTGSPAQAELGCQCVKLGAPWICTGTIDQCLKYGGICLAPCAYEPKRMRRADRKKM